MQDGRMVLSKAGWHEVESAERVGWDQGHSTLTLTMIMSITKMMMMIHDYYDDDNDDDDS